ncbi:MAG: YigZ family protein [Bacteroidetes bacterium]|nr:YigZ family protein [Bacteroidota bacterium]
MQEIRDEYLTVADKSEGLYKEKGSKFIALCFPVSNEEEIHSILDKLRKEYHDARHHCYAYRLGVNDDRYRMNDDGEPGGSAGRPIFGQILSNDLTDVLIVVIRYFGGIKLGMGGLAAAYKAASKESIENANIIKKIITKKITICFEYPLMNEVMRTIKEHGLRIVNQAFTTDCRVTLEARVKQYNLLVSIFGKIHGVKIE